MGGPTDASGVSGCAPNASIIAHLLRGTVAAVRCRELLDRGDEAAAHVEYLYVKQAIQALGRTPLDDGFARKLEALVLQQIRLRRAFRDRRTLARVSRRR